MENGGKEGKIRGHRISFPDEGVGRDTDVSLPWGTGQITAPWRADQGTGRRPGFGQGRDHWEILRLADVWGLSLKIWGLRAERATS